MMTALVCRPMALMLLCEFILNSTRAPPGEEFLYHTLLELHLMGDEEDQAAQPAGVATAEPSRPDVSSSSQPSTAASTLEQRNEVRNALKHLQVSDDRVAKLSFALLVFMLQRGVLDSCLSYRFVC